VVSVQAGDSIRQDIQALRAVAVALVLVVHLWPSALPGGFIGVDVFFVISGFLIIGHLLRQVETTGWISLSSFWARRIRRLLPAAGVVLLASLVGMVVLLPQSLWQRTVAEVAASALYVQNWLLGANAVDYFAANNQPTIVQHFWSLSVEEQFYIAWPLLILMTIMVFRRMQRKALIVLLVVVVAASFIWSVAETAVNQPAAYFSTLTRAWEFGAGGLLALAPNVLDRIRDPRFHHGVAIAASWLGYGLILASAVLMGPDTAFPGYIAAIPVVGTLLVLAARGHGGSWSASYIGTFGPVRLVGDVSYSLYLWHWPLIVLAPYALGKTPGWKWSLVILALAVVLAIASKYLVEDPIRTRTWWVSSSRRAFGFGAAMIALVVAVSGATWIAVQSGKEASELAAGELLVTDECYGASSMMLPGSCPQPFAIPTNLNTAFAAEDNVSIGKNCGPQLDEFGFRVCLFGETDNPTYRVALVGNSHASQLTPGLDTFAKQQGWEIVLLTKRGCLGLTSLEVPGAPDSGCIEWSARVNDELHREDIDAVILATHRNALAHIAPDNVGDDDRERLQESIEDTYRSLIEAGKAVVVLGDTPQLKMPAPECIDLNYGEYDPCSFPLTNRGDSIATDAARATTGVELIDLTPYFCDNSTCHIMIGSVVAFFDNNHISATYSRTMGPWLGDSIAKYLE